MTHKKKQILHCLRSEILPKNTFTLNSIKIEKQELYLISAWEQRRNINNKS